MLVVLAIIAILIALAAPGVIGSLNASKLTSSGDRLLGTLSEAQQTAFARNQAVEVRFYQYNQAMGYGNAFRAFQSFMVGSSPGANVETLTKLSELVKLPEGTVVSPEPLLSPLLNQGLIDDTTGDVGVPGARYAALRFFPDGTCKLVVASGNLATVILPSLPESFVTVVEEGAKTGAGGAPDNFYTVQVDPYTGRSRSYRPGF